MTDLSSALIPQWLAHRYDPTYDAFQFVSVDRAQRQAVPFLTDEYLGHVADPLVISRSDMHHVAKRDCRPHFIFHSAYCCSTLLVNALDQPGLASGFKEPMILNDLVGWRHRGGDPAIIGEVLATSLRIISRPFMHGEAAVIKPSNAVNGLATAMMTVQPMAHAILLYAPLKAFLVSIARKGMWGRLWVRELLSLQLKDGLVDLGFVPQDYLRHTDLQAAAVSWLTQHKLFLDMARRWPSRVKSLCSDDLTAHPVAVVEACARFFGLDKNTQSFSTNVTCAFGRNAKDGSTFISGQREEAQRDGEALHAEEIEKVLAWAKAVAQVAHIPMTLPSSLLSG